MVVPQYPICLNVTNERCLIIGGGKVAARKVAELVTCGASVHVVSPEMCAEMREQIEEHEISFARREFVEADVEGALIVIAATDDREVNERVASAARQCGAIYNVVDVPELCRFTAPAVVRRGPLTVTVSTTGTSPALAGRLRRELDEILAPEWGPALEEIRQFRLKLLQRLAHEPERRGRVLKQITRLDLVDIVKKQGRSGLGDHLESLLAASDEEEGSDG